MRVLHIITGLHNGGAEAILYRLTTADKENNHQVISLMDMGLYGEKLSHSGIYVHTLKMPRGHLTLHGLTKLFRLIRKIKPDVVQTWMYHANLIGGVIARLCGIQTVVWGIHHSDLDIGKTSRRTRLVVLVGAWLSWFVSKRIVFCSDIAAATHVSMGYNCRKVAVVHNGINILEFRPYDCFREKLRKEFGVLENEILIGMVARWDTIKDHATLITALAHLKSLTNRPWRCILIGTDMDESNQELVYLLEKRGVRDRFIFTGPREDIPVLMNALDLHVLSSSGEAFGNVTIEAMASGVPAVVTSVGAGEFIVGETGWVVPPSNPEAMSVVILEAINEMADEESWVNRKLACRSRAVENFGLERMVNAYRVVWNTAIKKDVH